MPHKFMQALFFLLSMTVCSLVRAKSPASTAAIQPAAKWSHLPTAKWPQIVLTNEATFDGHTPLYGASAFFMRMPDGEIIVGTAKHLIKKPGGVDPPIALTELDHVLTRWRVYPRTKKDQVVEAKGVAERTNGEGLHDWLLLYLKNPAATLSATPLVPRKDPVKVGEKVYLIGVPYSDRTSSQNIYKGVVTARPMAHYFTFEFRPPVHIEGFSGAPIVDARGLLVGHGVSRSVLKKQNGKEIEFGGEDSTLALELWRHRHDGPVVKPADVLHMTLPKGWEKRKSLISQLLQSGRDRALLAYFDLVAVPKADFFDSTTLMDWAAKVKANVDRSSKLMNREVTDLKEVTVGGCKTVQYDMSGKYKDFTLRYRIIMLESHGCFCKFTCWTIPIHWKQAQAKFEELVGHLK